MEGLRPRPGRGKEGGDSVKERCVGRGGEHGGPQGSHVVQWAPDGVAGDEAGMCLTGLVSRGP